MQDPRQVADRHQLQNMTSVVIHEGVDAVEKLAAGHGTAYWSAPLLNGVAFSYRGTKDFVVGVLVA